jgi:hypothetical protein
MFPRSKRQYCRVEAVVVTVIVIVGPTYSRRDHAFIGPYCIFRMNQPVPVKANERAAYTSYCSTHLWPRQTQEM